MHVERADVVLVAEEWWHSGCGGLKGNAQAPGVHPVPEVKASHGDQVRETIDELKSEVKRCKMIIEFMCVVIEKEIKSLSPFTPASALVRSLPCRPQRIGPVHGDVSRGWGGPYIWS